MIQDRDLSILVAGGVLALLGLFVPASLMVRMGIGVFILFVAMLIAVMRFGPDRIPLEQWIIRRIRYANSARKYNYYGQSGEYAPQAKVSEEKPGPFGGTAVASPMPIRMTTEDIPGGFYSVVSIFLAVVGIYVIIWIAQGGAEELIMIIK